MTLETDICNAVIATMTAKSSGIPQPSLHQVTINFHPDRLTQQGEPLLAAIANDGRLKSQFETGTSNGGLTAYQGGDRWLWEQRVFDGAYDHAPDVLRPKYGALNYLALETGASPRFGSSYFVLQPHTLKRTSYCYPDSFFEPEHFAANEYLTPLIELAHSSNSDALDNYIEAHVHGQLSLTEDVKELVLDPSFQGSEVEDIAQRMELPVRWHAGYRIAVKVVEQNPEYRGKQIVEVAKDIAKDGWLTPYLLGEAVNQNGFDQQDVKKVWHYLARFGYQG
ncbi:DUF3626 domain-containing protein [Vibrio sp. DBSS07]|uniref:DUF3626 domain-containing protein n=1 Tax=Vibrio paucivorans TaxID=2829489 RepID=A0A9X3HTN0_9VIBR|nr:DUF3626 domain-containing protein [Vibrio paucivorans]MCW8335277.1 DUF3626 domain-containing protein [Vibrio paucivorans]